MESLKEILDELILFLKSELLSRGEKFKNVEIDKGFVFKKRPFPPFKTVVTGKIGGGKITEAGFGGRDGGKKLELKFDFSIYLGSKNETMFIEEVFLAIVEGLMLSKNGFYVGEIERGKMTIDKETGAVILPFEFKCDYYLSKEAKPILINDIILKTDIGGI